jgi:hypothetical protein
MMTMENAVAVSPSDHSQTSKDFSTPGDQENVLDVHDV